ncbi:MAG: helix-turn-helix domain-containing protein [Armatimonas sp.]
MKAKKADVIFHPVRMRMVQAFFGDRRLTVHQLAGLLEGVAIATVYRHLNRLVEAQVLQVVEERPTRGTVEKVYALAGEQAASFSADDTRQASANEQKHNFNILLTTLQSDYERYLDQETYDPHPDGVMIRQRALNLTDDEALTLNEALKAVLAPYIGRPLEGERRRRMLTLLDLPIVESPMPE